MLISNMALSKPRDDLDPHIVPLEELQLIEYAFKCQIDFTKSPRKDPEYNNLVKLVVAILNGCGGTIYVRSRGKTPDKRTIDKWVRELHDSLTTIGKGIRQTCIQIIPWKSDVKIVLLKSPELIVYLTNLYIRMGARNHCVNDIGALHTIINQEQTVTEHLNIPQIIRFGDDFPWAEGPNIELKDWTITYVQEFTIQFHYEKTRKCLQSFPNTKGGGHMFIGVRESGGHNVVVGVILEESDEAEFKAILLEVLSTGILKGQDGMGLANHSPREGHEYSVRFHPVSDTKRTCRRVLIQITIHQQKYGVFEAEPITFTTSADGRAEKLPTEAWVGTTGNQISSPAATGESSVPKNLVLTEKSSVCTSTSSTNASSINTSGKVSVRPKQAISTEGITKGVQHLKSLSYASHTYDWKRNLQDSSMDLTQNITDLALNSDILQARKPPNITPRLESVISKPDQRKRVLSLIEAEMYDGHGFAVISEDVITNFEHVPHSEKPKYHICDALAVDQQGGIQLWSFISQEGEHADFIKQKTRVISNGRILKLKLMTCKPHGETIKLQNFGVSCYLYTIDGKKRWSLKTQETQPCQFEMVQICLATMMLNNSTSISTILGDSYSIHLTSRQMEYILKSGCMRYTQLEGAPGSGKSFLAYYLCSRYGKEQTLYICSTKPYFCLLQYKDNCIPLLVEKDRDLLQALGRGILRGKRCVIIDDAHHYYCQKGTWWRLFSDIHKHPQLFTFLLTDNSYQNYLTTPANLSKLMSQFCSQNAMRVNVTHLTVVHRNTKKVISFIKSVITRYQGPNLDEITCSSRLVGDDVEIRRVEDMMQSSKDNAVITLLRQLVTDKTHTTYQPADIAILVDTPDAEADVETLLKMLKQWYPECSPQNACTYPVTGVRVVTLKKFVGLDAGVCICIPAMWKGDNGEGFCNPRYRTYAASRGVHKVVFLVQKAFDADLVKYMQLDNTAYEEGRK